MGDIVGRSGRRAVQDGLSALKDKYQPTFSIANGENAAGGVGITPDIADDLFHWGIDGITLGNHAFNKRDIYPYLDQGHAIIRPSNMPAACPGKGYMTLKNDGIELFVMNLCCRIFMEPYDDPFPEMTRLLEKVETPHRFLDFHGEATSEKIAMACWLDGRVTAIVGTHTHVQTADERILPQGTAAITDVGMTGPMDGVLGMNRSLCISRFLTGMPVRFEPSDSKGTINGVVIEANRADGKAVSISRFTFSP